MAWDILENGNKLQIYKKNHFFTKQNCEWMNEWMNEAVCLHKVYAIYGLWLSLGLGV